MKLEKGVDLKRKPWGLRKDGDLWQRIHANWIKRGPQSLKVAKLLGHATQGDLAAGASTEALQRGNDWADSLAKRGRDLNPDFGPLWQWVDQNTQRYVQFFAKIHLAMLNILMKVIALTNTSLFRLQAKPKVLVPEPTQQNGVFHDLPRYQANLMGEVRMASAAPLLNFALTSEWQFGEIVRTSWLELMLDYLISGGPIQAFVLDWNPIRPTTYRRALRLFSAELKGILRVHMRPDLAAHFMQDQPQASLKRLAISSVVRVANARPKRSIQIIEAIQSQLLSLRKGADPRSKLPQREGQLLLPLVPLVLDRAMQLPGHLGRARGEVGDHAIAQLSVHSYGFRCRTCLTPNAVMGKPVPIGQGWPLVYCPGCRAKRRVGLALAKCCDQRVRDCRCAPPFQQVSRASILQLLGARPCPIGQDVAVPAPEVQPAAVLPTPDLAPEVPMPSMAPQELGMQTHEAYRVTCNACHVLAVLHAWPRRLPTGWPRKWCGGCKRQHRLPNYTCVCCHASVDKCSCSAPADP